MVTRTKAYHVSFACKLMAKSRIIDIEGIGPVTLVKKRRGSGITIMVKPFQGVIIRIPYWLSYRSGLNFLEKKRSWVLKSLDKVSHIESAQTLYQPGETKISDNCVVAVTEAVDQQSAVRLHKGKVNARYNAQKGYDDPEFQEMIRTVIVRALRNEAKQVLPLKLQRFSARYSLYYNAVRFKSAKTRWGSCSHNNNINLNVHLMRLPEHLIDYVILHELAHTREKNHGPGFWSLLNEITEGKARRLDKELKQYHIEYY